MLRKQQRKKPRPLELAPINRESEPLQLELPYLELSPLEPGGPTELPEIIRKPFHIELPEANQDGAAERDRDSR